MSDFAAHLLVSIYVCIYIILVQRSNFGNPIEVSYYIGFPNYCVLQLGVTQCTNVLLMISILLVKVL